MEAHFPAGANTRLMNLMTIARMDQSPENAAALLAELQEGPVTLLVPAEPPDAAKPQQGVTFTHVFTIEGETTMVAFTSEAAVRTFAKEDLCDGRSWPRPVARVHGRYRCDRAGPYDAERGERVLHAVREAGHRVGRALVPGPGRRASAEAAGERPSWTSEPKKPTAKRPGG